MLGLSSSAALTLLEGCDTSIAPGGRVGLTYWNLLGGDNGVCMIQMEGAFSASHPTTALKGVTLAWGEAYYTKVAVFAFFQRQIVQGLAGGLKE